jgi:hypothetical protein
VELAADASSAAPASLATRVAATGVDATPAIVQLGAAEGTPATVNASVTSTPGPTVNSPVAVVNVACNTRAGSEKSVASRHADPEPALDPATHPNSFPNGSSPASSRAQHTSPVSAPSAKPVAVAEESETSTRHDVASAVAAATASLYVAQAPAPGKPVTASTPRSRHAYELVPHAALAAARAASRPQVSSQQSPPSKHGATFRSASQTPSPTRASALAAHGFEGSAGLNVVAAAPSAAVTFAAGTTNVPPATSVNRTTGFEMSRASSAATNQVVTRLSSPALARSVGAHAPPRSPSPSTARFEAAPFTWLSTRERTAASSHVPHEPRQLGPLAAPHAPPSWNRSRDVETCCARNHAPASRSKFRSASLSACSDAAPTRAGDDTFALCSYSVYIVVTGSSCTNVETSYASTASPEAASMVGLASRSSADCVVARRRARR